MKDHRGQIEDRMPHILRGYFLDGIADPMAEKIFTEMFQGDELAEKIEDYMAQKDLLDLDDPDYDIHTNEQITDEVWFRIMVRLAQHIRETQRPQRR